MKKILECVCINCGKLKADIVSGRYLSSSHFAPTIPIFWCALHIGEPKCASCVSRSYSSFAAPCKTNADAFYLCKSDPKFADKIQYIKDPKKRMSVVWAHCKTTMVCESDDAKAQKGGAEHEKGHGGCGDMQPHIYKQGLQLFVQYTSPNGDTKVRNPFTSLRRS